MKEKLKKIKPYGDTLNDGAIQLSFTLPLEAGPRADAAALELSKKMGLADVHIAHSNSLGPGFSFFVVYGKSKHLIDVEKLKFIETAFPVMEFDEVNDYIKKNIGRKIVVAGACTGTDAHTVGIDSIMNMKGFHGNPGLERYPEVIAYNLGSQVRNEDLIAKAIEVDADAILVSQVVTQKDIHLANLTNLVDLLEAEEMRDNVVLVVGGPRITPSLAKELGYDAGFGPGTLPQDVASFIAYEMIRRKGGES